MIKIKKINIFIILIILLMNSNLLLNGQMFRIIMPQPQLDVDIYSYNKIFIKWDEINIEKKKFEFIIRIIRITGINEEIISESNIADKIYIDEDLEQGIQYSYKAHFIYKGEKISDNSETIKISLPVTEYSFYVAGHVYGVPGVNSDGVYHPFKNKFDYINYHPYIEFGVFTGDIVITSNIYNWDKIDIDLELLNKPVYFSYGNHDYSNPSLLISRYGPTYKSFIYNNDLFLILNSEIGPHNIKGDQLNFIKNELGSANDFRNIFVFVHRLIWISENTKYKILEKKINSTVGYDFNSNFWNEIEPLFHGLKAQVYFFAGDLGVSVALPAFYDHYDNICFIASGMGGNPEENFLIVNVTNGDLIIEMISLQDIQFKFSSIKDYNLKNISKIKLAEPIFLEEHELID